MLTFTIFFALIGIVVAFIWSERLQDFVLGSLKLLAQDVAFIRQNGIRFAVFNWRNRPLSVREIDYFRDVSTQVMDGKYLNIIGHVGYDEFSKGWYLMVDGKPIPIDPEVPGWHWAEVRREIAKMAQAAREKRAREATQRELEQVKRRLETLGALEKARKQKKEGSTGT